MVLRSEVIDIVQLKAYIRQLAQQEKLPSLDYRALNGALDNTAYGLVDELSQQQLPQLIERLQQIDPQLDLSRLKPFYQQQSLSALVELRQQGLAARPDANGRRWVEADSSLFGDIGGTPYRLPLDPFSWAAKSRQFTEILFMLGAPQCDLTKLYPLVEAFFDSKDGPKRLAGLPEFGDNLERELFAAGVGQKEQKQAYRADLYEVRQYLHDNEAQMRLMFNCAEVAIDHPYQGQQQMLDLLKKELILPRPSIDLALLILLWQGPAQYQLCRQLFESEQSVAAKRLLLVRSGIDIDTPGGKAALYQWCDDGQNEEYGQYQQLLEQIDTNKLIFDVLQMAAFSAVGQSSSEHKLRWLTAAVELAQKKIAPVQSQLEHSDPQPEVVFEAVVLPPLLEQADAQDIAELAAPAAKLTKADEIIERHSSWDQYVKPFMSENWMGLIGIGFIMVAWAILSMMVWDQSEYYRLAAGALPLLLMSIGGAKVSHFFAKLSERQKDECQKGEFKEAYQKPVQLFCALSILTIPFNILMAISMFDSGVYTIAFALLAVYGVSLRLIAPWLSHGFGADPTRYLLVSHGLLLLPTVVAGMWPGNVAVGLALMSFLALGLFMYRLSKAYHGEQVGSESAEQSFVLWLSGAHLSLCLAASHTFYGQMPSLGTAAVFVALLALCLSYIVKGKTQIDTEQKAKMVILGSAATLLSQLLAWAQPLYLLVTLLLSALFWAGHRRLFVNRQWPAEIFAVHFVAYVAALQFNFGYSDEIVFAMALAALASIVLIEKRWLGRALKLLNWGLPLALLAAGAGIDVAGAIGYGIFAILMALAWYNYRRCAEFGDVTTWYIAVLVLAGLPVIEFELWQMPLYLALYCAAVAALWALGSGYLQDDCAKQQRCTMLWALSAAAAGLLVHVAVEAEFQLVWPWFGALALNLVALLLAARNAQSLLPLYGAAGLVAIAAFWARYQFDLVSNSGLGSALGALALIVLAPRLQSSRYFAATQTPPRCFGQYFPFYSKHYLRLALEQMSWALLAASFVKTIMLFAPIMENFKLSLAGVCQIAGLLLLAVRYQKPALAALAFLPLTVVLAAIGVSIGSAYLPVFVVALLLLLFWGIGRLHGESPLRQVVTEPLTRAHQWLKWLFVLASVFAYPLMLKAHSPLWLFGAYVVMTLVYIDQVFCAAGKGRFAHLNLLHVAIICALSFAQGIEPNYYGQWSWYLICLSLGMFVFAYISDWFGLAVAKTYHDTIQHWLVGLSALLLAVLWTLYNDPPAGIQYLNSPLMAMTLICLHLANRAYQLRLGFLAKWLVCSLWVQIYLDNQLYALLGGVFVFFAVEGLWHQLSKNPMQWQGIGALRKTPSDKIAQVGVIALGVIVLVHLAGIFGAGVDTIAPYWLWALLPLAVYLYRQLSWPMLSYAVALIFVYANVFVVLGFSAQASRYGLAPINLLSGALVVSVLGLALANKLMRTMGGSMTSATPVEAESLEVAR